MSIKKQTNVELKKYIARKGLFIRIPIPEKLKELEPEISLGRSILDRALLDSLTDEGCYDWFDIHSEDFNTICYIAYLDPEKVMKRFNITHERLQRKEVVGDVLIHEN